MRKEKHLPNAKTALLRLHGKRIPTCVILTDAVVNQLIRTKLIFVSLVDQTRLCGTMVQTIKSRQLHLNAYHSVIKRN